MVTVRIVAGVALAAWAWLAVARGMYWRTNIRLPVATAPAQWPSVVVVVPARDEADVLPLTLSTLVEQDYPGPLRVILVDDNSTDGTRALVAESWPDVRVVTPGEPPAGWAGKLWALRAGVAAVAEGAHASAEAGVAADPKPGVAATAEPGVAADPKPGVAVAGEPGVATEPRPAVAAERGAAAPVEAGSPEGVASAVADAATARFEPVTATTETASDVDYFLFTDADIAHAPDSLSSLVRAAEAHRLDLVSQMARLRVHTRSERVVVPAFVYFFALLYPFRWSNKPFARTAAAAGGCSLVRRTALERAGGLEVIRGAVIDDVALAKALKRAGGRTFLGLADRVDSVRPYPRLNVLWQMVARSAFAQLRHSFALLVGTVAGLALLFWVPPASVVVGAVTGDLPTLLLGAAAWLLLAGLYVPMLRYYRLPWAMAGALPFTATLYLGMTVDSAVQHVRGRGAAWKGRTYSRA